VTDQRPPFNIGAVDEARALAARAERLHREADDIVAPWRSVNLMGEQDGRPVLLARLVVHEAASPEVQRAAALRRVACDLDREADDLVPVEHRG
jgi:hypothetical protein